MPIMLMALLGAAILVFFMNITVHFLSIEKKLRSTFILVEVRVKRFLESGRD